MPLNTQRPSRLRRLVLLFSVFVVASCGLVYELLAGTLSSYLLGNSVTQFSVVIGLFLSAMGLGSWLSRYVKKRMLPVFLGVEIAVGLVGGFSALILFFAFAVLDSYGVLLLVMCIAIGALVGLEIPLLLRIMKQETSLRRAVGNVLALDYLGALLGSLLFPFLLLPSWGLVRTGFFFGLLNVLVALLGAYVFRDQLKKGLKSWVGASVLSSLVLTIGLATAPGATTWLEDQIYEDEIVYAKTTAYQRIVITRWRDDFRLFLDGNLQFSSKDEFRYHEALVHPALGARPNTQSVLILGGGDGMVAREVLKHKGVQTVELVDLDQVITDLFRNNELLVDLNARALRDKRVRIVNQDALQYLEETDKRFDVIIMDLPDPNNESLAKLYSRSFFKLVLRRLKEDGVLVSQATSPFFAQSAFWCIVHTLEAAKDALGRSMHSYPYHVNVPSFGEWGFVMASLKPIELDQIRLVEDTRFLSSKMLLGLFVFPKDMQEVGTDINRLDQPAVVDLYEKGYRQYNQ
jgi:spermidine synthase